MSFERSIMNDFKDAVSPDEKEKKRVEKEHARQRDLLYGRLMRTYGVDKSTLARFMFNMQAADGKLGDDFERRLEEQIAKAKGVAVKKGGATIPNLNATGQAGMASVKKIKPQ